jgi:DNA primase
MFSAKAFGLSVRGSSGGEELVVCPFHHDHSPSAWFNPKKGLFYCSVCHLGLNISQLAKKLGVRLDEVEEVYSTDREEPEEYNLFEEQLRLDLGEEVYHPYFQKRNISEEAISAYGVRWSSAKDAAVMPISDLQGVIRGATYRRRSGRVRYYSQGQRFPLWPMRLLPALDLRRPVLITEGPFSALRIATVSPQTQSLCLFGSRATQTLVEAIRPLKAILLYDGDLAGRTACLRLRRMAPSISAYTTEISPDDMTEEEIYELLGKIQRRIA